MAEVKSYPCFLSTKRLQPEYPLFVFLPGMDGTGKLLQRQTDGLEVAFDVRCLAIPPDDSTNWDDLSNQVLQLIQEELKKNPNRSVYLCGESFGGCLAMKVAIASPKLFSRIILVNPASSFHLRPWLEWVSQLAYFVPCWLYHISALGLLPFLVSLGRVAESDRRDVLKTMRSVPPETVLWRLSLVKEFNVTATELSRLNQPVLVIGSLLDRLLPSMAEARRLVNIFPNPTQVALPTSGHACLLEEDINLYEIMQAHNFLDCNAQAVALKVSPRGTRGPLWGLGVKGDKGS